MIPEQVWSLSEVAVVSVISLLIILEVVKIVFRKKLNGGSQDKSNKELLEQVKLIESNHLHSIESAIVNSNKEVVKAINDGNNKTIELLSKIEGLLSR